MTDAPAKTGHNSAEHLRSLVARIERLETEKAELATDIREVYAEVKAHGLDAKIVRQVVRLRKLDRAELAEQQALLDRYMEVFE